MHMLATQKSVKVVLVFLSAFNAIFLFFSILNYKQQQLPALENHTENYTYLGNSYPSTVPLPGGSLPSISYTFEESTRFGTTNASVPTWWGNLARQLGYVRLGPKKRIFAVSMVHQQHCLHLFAKALATQSAPNAHLQHCFNYLRQNLLCQADATLEPPGWTEREFDSERVGGTRECGDWSAVYAFVEDNYWDWMAYRQENWISS
ncbi:hypothetical protein DFH11DRAFT_951021 [Phellopilus nigrolimitatus]|nr:hypothetical protein DFH11DRAFT_951021 [Phellopilus nigrolimitatus]